MIKNILSYLKSSREVDEIRIDKENENDPKELYKLVQNFYESSLQRAVGNTENKNKVDIKPIYEMMYVNYLTRIPLDINKRNLYKYINYFLDCREIFPPYNAVDALGIISKITKDSLKYDKKKLNELYDFLINEGNYIEAKKLYEITKIRPKIDYTKLQEIYKKLLKIRPSFWLEELTTWIEITNIPISDKVIKEVGLYFLEEDPESLQFEKYKQTIRDLTGKDVIIKEEEIKEIYKRKIDESTERINRGGNIKQVCKRTIMHIINIYEKTKVMPDKDVLEATKEMIEELLFHMISIKNGYGLEKIYRVCNTLNIKMDLDEETAQEMYYTFCALDDWSNNVAKIKFIEGITDKPISHTTVQKIYEGLIERGKLDSAEIIYKHTHIDPEPTEEFIENIHKKYLFGDDPRPKYIEHVLEFLKANPKENIIHDAIRDKLQKRQLREAYEIAKTFDIEITDEIKEYVATLLKK